MAVRSEGSDRAPGTNETRPGDRARGAGPRCLPDPWRLRSSDPFRGLSRGNGSFRLQGNRRQVHRVPVRDRSRNTHGLRADGSLGGWAHHANTTRCADRSRLMLTNRVAPIGSTLLQATVVVGVLVSLVLAYGGSAAAANPVSAPNIQRALVMAGYPAKSGCGQAMVPPPSCERQSDPALPRGGDLLDRRGANGYAAHVIPYTSARLAKLAYDRTFNPAATTTRKAAIGNVVLTAFRLPRPEWQRISGLVTSAVERKR